MIFRFSCYGFLKNLRLFEAFLVLALLERGLDFLAIGGLIAVREVTVNLFEVPSGALADGFGRKRCMVASMVAYIAAYLVLGLASSGWVLALGMASYGIGDAFRSGTHKALIYAWLRQQNRQAERTEVYGYTRSWSKIGSACSALAGGAVLVAGLDYRWVFFASVLPAFLNLINLASYPASLDQPSGAVGAAVRDAFRHLREGFRLLFHESRLRRLMAGSMAVEGSHTVSKDYLQPLLQSLAIALPLGLGLDGDQRTGLLVGGVAAAGFLLASFASRNAHRLERAWGSADRAARRLALLMGVAYALLGLCLPLGWAWIAVPVFVALTLLANLWRPIHVGRFDRDGEAEQAATTLSIEAQAKAGAAALLAPLLGLALDLTSRGAAEPSAAALWPVALLGVPVLLGWIIARPRPRPQPG